MALFGVAFWPITDLDLQLDTYKHGCWYLLLHDEAVKCFGSLELEVKVPLVELLVPISFSSYSIRVRVAVSSDKVPIFQIHEHSHHVKRHIDN